jgi:hypothetical protein
MVYWKYVDFLKVGEGLSNYVIFLYITPIKEDMQIS